MGPPPRVHVYEHGKEPLMRIRVQGTWHTCTVRARHDWPDGRVAYQVDIRLVTDGAEGTVSRTYWWNPDTMRPVRT